MAVIEFHRDQNILPQKGLWAVLLGLILMLPGCISPVEYGKIHHSEFTAHPRCAPPSHVNGSSADTPYFFVTSRLPDCRSDNIRLLNHRGDKIRFGWFGAPKTYVSGKKKDIFKIPVVIADEQQWWKSLAEQMEQKNGRVLLYVHGFNETFVSSSKDTAQIARLTNFDGPIIQYSWPSQGEILKYAVDETNMYWAERNFRHFLMKLAQQKWTKEIVLVSHSLGARLVIPSVEFVDRNSTNADSSNISNIILASPDIDRQNFERDIAEEILAARRVRNNRRITIYVSANDSALSLSDNIHGYPRLGTPRCFDPRKVEHLKGRGLPNRCYASHPRYKNRPELNGLTIVDTTEVSVGRTGHSDYLRSASVCQDFAAVVGGQRRPKLQRIATHLPHVFALGAYDKKAKIAHRSICKRNAQ